LLLAVTEENESDFAFRIPLDEGGQYFRLHPLHASPSNIRSEERKHIGNIEQQTATDLNNWTAYHFALKSLKWNRRIDASSPSEARTCRQKIVAPRISATKRDEYDGIVGFLTKKLAEAK